jgi:hypothetical protein
LKEALTLDFLTQWEIPHSILDVLQLVDVYIYQSNHIEKAETFFMDGFDKVHNTGTKPLKDSDIIGEIFRTMKYGTKIEPMVRLALNKHQCDFFATIWRQQHPDARSKYT